MKLLVINPNISRRVTATAVTAARAAAKPGTMIVGVTAPFGVAYVATRSENVVAAHATLTALAGRLAKDAFDGVIIAAFTDPGLDAACELAPCPVAGMARAAIARAVKMVDRFAIVTAAPSLVAVLQDLVRAYGHAKRCVGVVSMPAGAVDLAGDVGRSVDVLARLSETAIKKGAEAIVLGGAPLAAVANAIQSRIDRPLVEGIAAAVQELEAGRARASSRLERPIGEMKAAHGITPQLAACLGATLDDAGAPRRKRSRRSSLG